MSPDDTYRALASGDPDAVRQFAPRVATLAEAARKQRASAPSPAASAPRAPASIVASTAAIPRPTATRAPAPSRSAQVAAVHLSGINESRRRCGLAPLTLAEFSLEFAEIDQLPPHRSKGAARTPPPPASQAAIDDRWSTLVNAHNTRSGIRTPVQDRSR
jgi:hypothetical protein